MAKSALAHIEHETAVIVESPEILRKIEDPSTYGANLGTPMIVIMLNKGPDNLVELGVYPGTTKHPSYKYGIKGEVVGKFPAPTAYESVFPDFANKNRLWIFPSLLG